MGVTYPRELSTALEFRAEAHGIEHSKRSQLPGINSSGFFLAILKGMGWMTIGGEVGVWYPYEGMTPSYFRGRDAWWTYYHYVPNASVVLQLRIIETPFLRSSFIFTGPSLPTIVGSMTANITVSPFHFLRFYLNLHETPGLRFTFENTGYPFISDWDVGFAIPAIRRSEYSLTFSCALQKMRGLRSTSSLPTNSRDYRAGG